MRLLFIILPHCFASVHCFASGPRISADVDFSYQTKELRKCIKDTTDHYIEQIIAMGGSSSDRLPFSISQIQQLCIATSGQISDMTSTPQPPRFITSLSTHGSTAFVQPATVTLSHVLVDTSVSATITTPMQETTVSTIQTSTSTVTISTTQSSQTTITEQSTVVFGPALPPTLSAADVEKERKRLLKELNVFTIIMQILTLG
jgi:hypothetical protein